MCRSLAAQTLPSPQFIDVGSERERILRVLQLVGQVRAYPWSIRAFSPNERDWLTPKSDWGEAFFRPSPRRESKAGSPRWCCRSRRKAPTTRHFRSGTTTAHCGLDVDSPAR